jgi:hypothetical protein
VDFGLTRPTVSLGWRQIYGNWVSRWWRRILQTLDWRTQCFDEAGSSLPFRNPPEEGIMKVPLSLVLSTLLMTSSDYVRAALASPPGFPQTITLGPDDHFILFGEELVGDLTFEFAQGTLTVNGRRFLPEPPPLDVTVPDSTLTVLYGDMDYVQRIAGPKAAQLMDEIAIVRRDPSYETASLSRGQLIELRNPGGQ